MSRKACALVGCQMIIFRAWHPQTMVSAWDTCGVFDAKRWRQTVTALTLKLCTRLTEDDNIHPT
eukprot:3206314-Alexandrium_andersonii.AAC.1